MLDKETYDKLLPYKGVINKVKSGSLPNINQFHEVYAIYRNKFTSINEFCSSCVKEMWDNLFNYIEDYERREL